MFAGGVQRQATPSASDIQKPLAGLQTQLAAHQFEFAPLGLVEAVAGRAEVGAGVGQRLAQPRLEKLHRLIVVVGDGSAVSAWRMGRSVLEPAARAGKRKRPILHKLRLPCLRAAQKILGDREDGKNIAFHLQIAADEGFAQGHFVLRRGQCSQRLGRFHNQGECRRLVLRGIPLPAIPKANGKDGAGVVLEKCIEDSAPFR